MRARVLATIRTRGLFSRGDTVLVACSGGPDSVALTHVLAGLRETLKVSLVVASVDHGLRPEAQAEVAQVRVLAASLGLPFAPLRVTVGTGDSLQARARDARYAALHEAAARAGARVIAVGHTRDDQAETVLDRLMRGAGLRGLAGIDPRRADGIVRPLIDVDRASIERYVRKHDLAVVRDPSNDATRFRRVRIRSAILPALVSESPKVIEHLADLADEARATVAMLDAQTPHLGEDLLPFSLLTDVPEPLLLATLRKLAMRVAKTPPSRAHLEALRNLVEKDGEVWLAGGVVVRRAEQGLVVDRSLQHSGHIERRKKRTPLSQIPEPGESQGSQD